jgi:hypothetical protein
MNATQRLERFVIAAKAQLAAGCIDSVTMMIH